MTHGSSFAGHAGSNSRNCIRAAVALGARVAIVRRTGEIRLSHPAVPESVKVPHPARRKDAPRSLTAWLRRVVRAIDVARAV